MEARTLAHQIALGRLAVGAALALAPRRTARAWVGRPGAGVGGQVLMTALGTRDVLIGLGAVVALRRGEDAAPWLRAGALADATDCAITLRTRSALPPTAVAGVSALAAASAVLGLWAAQATEHPGP